MKPLAIDLFCGLGGWTEALLAEGWSVVGFDIERHRYPKIVDRGAGSVKRPGMSWSGSNDPSYKAKAFNSTDDIEFLPDMQEYAGQLVLQDVLTLHGSQFRNASLIVASPPCQAYSYRAMPWKRAKALPPPSNDLFDACFRIQREASEAAGRYIPLIVENVKGAQPWVGRAKWHYGSFYLWGDVPALMPPVLRGVMKNGVAHRSNGETNFHGSAARAKASVGGDGDRNPNSPVLANGVQEGLDTAEPSGGGIAKRRTAGSIPATGAKACEHDGPCGDVGQLCPTKVHEDGACCPACDHMVGACIQDYIGGYGRKNGGGSWFAQAHNTTSGHGRNPVEKGFARNWRDSPNGMPMMSSKSNARKAASAQIAKIPFPLAQHIARVFHP